MKNRRKNREAFADHSYWQSYSDMMAALLLIFILIIAITLSIYRQKTTDLDNTRIELDKAQSQLNQTITDLENSKAELEKSNQELASSLTELQQAYAQAALTEEELNKAYLEIENAREELTTTKDELQAIVGIRTDIIGALQSAFNNSSMKVDAQTGSITFSSDVLFRYNSATLTSDSRKTLKEIIPMYLDVLLQDQFRGYIAEIIIEGHTDTDGGYQSNMELSYERANAVADFCLDKRNGLTETEIEQLQKILTVNGKSWSSPVYKKDAFGNALEEVDIRQAVEVHFRDIGQDADNHDVTYENAQARERTQVLMDIANHRNGLVIGTGDMSELALGWATYNGDHMSMYGVNAGVPKTLVRHLVQYYADTCNDSALADVLADVLDTPVSPELLPPVDGVISQRTEDLVGPYELHDFFLYYMLRCGYPPAKVYRVAKLAFQGQYEDGTILKWLKAFYRRFFAQQFKRSCLPDGPKVGSVALSPRGDLRMPSDASARLWLDQAEELA